MKLKPIAIGIAIAAALLCFHVGDYDRADSNLTTFYKQMSAADFLSARRTIDEAIRLWPTNARYYTWSGYCYSQKLPPQCPRCIHDMNSAMTEADRKSAEFAIEEYRHALQLNGLDAVAWHDLAWLEHLLGDDDAAEKDWQKATIIDPGNAVFHLSYGMVLDEIAKESEAQKQYEVAILLSPSIVESPFFIRYGARSPESAAAIVAHCVTTIEGKLNGGHDPILQARLGKLYQYLGDRKRSAQMLQEAAAQLPNLPLVWLNLGENYEASGSLTQAMDCYKKANIINPSLAGPYLRMAELYLQQGQKNLAATNFQMAAQRWDRVNPITASHNNRLYVGPRQLIDDLLPTTLVWYVSPCEASRAYGALAELYPGKPELVRRSRTCEDLPDPHLCNRR
jgi:tetratricopeptide (TPR) repeat protein